MKKTNHTYSSIKNNILHTGYTKVCKPIFFQFNPEKIHDRMIHAGETLAHYSITRKCIRKMFCFEHPALEQHILGIHFSNPIGLVAGFDKNAQLTNILPDVGFGFAEVGSITGEPCEGNPKPRLWRLKKSQSLLVYYGLKNDGAQMISERLRTKKFRIPIGISIARTNNNETCSRDKGIADYIKAYQSFEDIGQYFTINISCPNIFGGETFTKPDALDALLRAIAALPKTKPIFIKISPDLTHTEIDDILALVHKYHIDGIICANLTKKRENGKLIDTNIPDVGGMSGKVVQDISDATIKYIYSKTQGQLHIVGCGGVFTAEDAYRKIRSGASLIQLITGMIYEGPQTIGTINHDLVQLLHQDGFANIREAIGADLR